MRHNLTTSLRTVRAMNAQAAGTSIVNGSDIDMKQVGSDGNHFDAIRFVALFGALTATQVTTLEIQEADDNGSNAAGTYASVAATETAALADADGNKMLITDLYRPTKRWVRCRVKRGTANAVIDGVIAELYRSAKSAVAKDSTVSAQVVNAGI
jgi:hypothetical protein